MTEFFKLLRRRLREASQNKVTYDDKLGLKFAVIYYRSSLMKHRDEYIEYSELENKIRTWLEDEKEFLPENSRKLSGPILKNLKQIGYVKEIKNEGEEICYKIW